MDTAAKRREIKDQMPITSLGLEHTQNCSLLPNRNLMLDQMPKGGRVAEVGVAFGDFTNEILDRCNPDVLYLIDSWASPRYQKGLGEIGRRFEAKIANRQIVVMEGLSTDRLGDLADQGLDWVYIDTNHSYATTLAELEICHSLVAPDGRISGHDFCTGNVVGAIPYGVVEAVTKFCKDHNWQFEFLTVESSGHFSFCLKRIAAN